MRLLHDVAMLAGSIAHGVAAHLALWEGWAVVLASALLVRQGAAWWLPIVAALVVNPEPFDLVTGLLHGRHPSLLAALTFTLCQIVLAYGGFSIARLAGRIR